MGWGIQRVHQDETPLTPFPSVGILLLLEFSYKVWSHGSQEEVKRGPSTKSPWFGDTDMKLLKGVFSEMWNL